jgi:hypothetical protein
MAASGPPADAATARRPGQKPPGGQARNRPEARPELRLGPEALNSYLEYKSIYAGADQLPN